MANNINIRLLRQTISAQGAKQIANLANDAIKVNFETKKKLFLQAFDEHPVTQELNAVSDNPTARSSFVARGNLFSLIGFNEGEKPALALRDYLNKNIKLKMGDKRTKIQNDRIIIETPVEIPTLSEVNDNMGQEVPLEWTDRPWTDLLQRGITGFGQFVSGLFTSPKPSRSGGGLQHAGKDVQLSGSVGPIKYVNELLARFKDLLGGKK